MTEEVSYLTPEGHQRLKKELAELKGPARDALSARLRFAIQQGDLSENADYIQAKEEQGFLEGRIQDLERILKNVVLIDENQSRDTVELGARVTIEEEDYPGEETYTVVGPKESDPANGRISHESPIGRALLGHKVGDLVIADTPNGLFRFKIVRIE